MNRITTKLFAVLASLCLLFLPVASQATVQSNVATIALTAAVPSTLTVSVDTAALNFTSNAPSNPVVRSMSWNFAPGQVTHVNLTVYFTTTTALSSPSTGATITTAEFVQITPSGSGTCNQHQNLGTGGAIAIDNTCGNDLSVSISSANLSSSSSESSTYQIGKTCCHTR